MCARTCVGISVVVQWFAVLSIQLPPSGSGEGSLRQHGLLKAAPVHTDHAYNEVSGGTVLVETPSQRQGKVLVSDTVFLGWNAMQ